MYVKKCVTRAAKTDMLSVQFRIDDETLGPKYVYSAYYCPILALWTSWDGKTFINDSIDFELTCVTIKVVKTFNKN